MAHVYELEGHTLDPRERTLRRGTADVHLRRRAFDVLTLLVERRGTLVDKATLLSKVWSDVTVGQHVLKVTIREVRAALGDDAREPRYVETVANGGYRFVGSVLARPSTGGERPAVRYARCRTSSVAYQSWGEARPTLVLVPGAVSHLDMQWEHPLPARFLRELGGLARVLTFDARGTGLSDRADGVTAPEERLRDIEAVLDAEGVRQAVLFGVGEGAATSALFAVTRPERTRGLVLYGGSPSPAVIGYSFERSSVDVDEVCARVLQRWGEPLFIEAAAPSVAEDAAFRAWWARYLRAAASPGTAAAMIRVAAALDLGPVLGAVRARTLVLHRSPRPTPCAPSHARRRAPSRPSRASRAEAERRPRRVDRDLRDLAEAGALQGLPADVAGGIGGDARGGLRVRDPQRRRRGVGLQLREPFPQRRSFHESCTNELELLDRELRVVVREARRERLPRVAQATARSPAPPCRSTSCCPEV